jgi:hypothetical protein
MMGSTFEHSSERSKDSKDWWLGIGPYPLCNQDKEDGQATKRGDVKPGPKKPEPVPVYPPPKTK